MRPRTTSAPGRSRTARCCIQEILPNGAAENAGLLEGDELVLIQAGKVAPQELDKAERFINSQPEGRILIYTVRSGRGGSSGCR